jgi:epoxide hydrolase
VSATDDVIQPFRIEVGDAELDDLHDRLARTRWPEAEPVDDWSQGIPLAYVEDVADYWRTVYDWRAREALLNRYPQFRTTVSGGGDDALAIHFLHVRSPEPTAMPLVLTHGWPGSTVEFMDVIGPLTDPVAHGGEAADAFHVVVPSLPGYGFSDKPARTGWGVERIATAWDELMGRLGYERYVAQGGDWGAIVTTAVGAQALGRCVGIHLNMPFARPTAEDLADLDDAGRRAIAKLQHYQDHDSGYSKQQSTRPQTVGYGLVDSPVGQLAWILEKYWAWTDNDGNPEDAIDRDRLLDNVMIYWLTRSAASSARLYWESFGGNRQPAVVDLPTGVSQFPAEVLTTSRRWAERIYTDIRHWHDLERGGHFAAFEEPDLFVDEVRTAVRAFGVR